MAEPPLFTQTTSFTQKDNLSPSLFSILVKDLPGPTGGPSKLVEVILCAKDLVIYGSNRFQVLAANLELTVIWSRWRWWSLEGKRAAATYALYIARLLCKPDSVLMVALLCERKKFRYAGHRGTHETGAGRKCDQFADPSSPLFSLLDFIAPIALHGVGVIWKDLTVENLR